MKSLVLAGLLAGSYGQVLLRGSAAQSTDSATGQMLAAAGLWWHLQLVASSGKHAGSVCSSCYCVWRLLWGKKVHILDASVGH